MSNPNNLVRPPILNMPANPPAVGLANMADLQAEIRRIVSEAVQEQTRVLAESIRNPAAQNDQADQIIEPQHRAQLSDLDRVPDVVRCLREFSGQAGEYSSWRKSIERILSIYQHLKGTAKYFGILCVIRNKIVGNADAVLESYNTPLNWESISRCLTLHYADKRDVSTLEYQLTSLVQGTESIQEFYQRVYNHLSLILNKISCMDIGQESLCLLTQTYRDKALDTFIRGLKGDLPRLLAMKEPVDLPKALHLCLKLENQNFRTNYANNVQTRQNNNMSGPPRKQFANIPHGFFPELAHTPPPPRPQKHQNQRQTPVQGANDKFQKLGTYPMYNNRNNFPPQRPFGQKPQPRPEPMDVDGSMRTRNVNYMNRPVHNDFSGKRPPPQHPEAHKHSRNFHVQSKTDDDLNGRESGEIEEYLNEIPAVDEETGQTFEEYVDDLGNYENEYDQESDNFNDIHFLD